MPCLGFGAVFVLDDGCARVVGDSSVDDMLFENLEVMGGDAATVSSGLDHLESFCSFEYFID